MIVSKNSFKTANASQAVSPSRATAIRAYKYSKFATNRNSRVGYNQPPSQIRYLKKGVPKQPLGTSQNITKILSIKSGLSYNEK